MESESSLRCSKEPSTDPYSEPDQSSPYHPHSISVKSILILSTHVLLDLPSGLFHLTFPPVSYMHSSYPYSCYMLCSSHPHWLDHSNYIWRRVQVMCSFLQPPATSSLFGSNILLSSLFSNTLSICSSLIFTDQVSHPYKTRKLTVSCI
jgi:hypothetical protein